MWIVFQIRSIRIPKSRNRCPDLGQIPGEQQFLLRYREEIVQMEYCNLMAPGLLNAFRIHASKCSLASKELIELETF